MDTDDSTDSPLRAKEGGPDQLRAVIVRDPSTPSASTGSCPGPLKRKRMREADDPALFGILALRAGYPDFAGLTLQQLSIRPDIAWGKLVMRAAELARH
jgi:hypothetical protein